ncbi:MAG: four helix bundle protein [Bradymonadia bacterium]
MRSSLTRRIEDVSLEILEALATAHYSKGPKRVRLLEGVDESLVRFKLLIRLAHTLRFLDSGAYEHVQRQVDEVGRRLGAWLLERRRALGGVEVPE